MKKLMSIAVVAFLVAGSMAFAEDTSAGQTNACPVVKTNACLMTTTNACPMTTTNACPMTTKKCSTCPMVKKSDACAMKPADCPKKADSEKMAEPSE